jgi:hypothetical protein
LFADDDALDVLEDARCLAAGQDVELSNVLRNEVT